MKSKRIGVLVLLLTVVLAVFPISCKEKDRTFDADEVIAATKALLPESAVLNEIYYGEGILPDETQTVNNYAKAKGSSLARYGISTVDDLKALTKKTYSSGVCNQIFNTKLSSVIDTDNTLVSYARYFEKTETDGAGNVIPVAFMVNLNAKADFTDRLSYHYEEISVDKAKGEKVYVNVPYTVTNQDGDEQTGVFHLALIEEAGGWRLDTLTYTNYNAYIDFYNDIKNQ